jgi:hypothetical protein
MSLVKRVEEEDEQIIKPEAVAPNVDTSNWPLLLKNWDQCKWHPAEHTFLPTILTRVSSVGPDRSLHAHPGRMHPSSP